MVDSNIAKTGVVVALVVFILSIIYPIAMQQVGTSYSCWNAARTNCTWGNDATYDGLGVMSTADITIWSNVPTFAILIILVLLAGVVLKSLGVF